MTIQQLFVEKFGESPAFCVRSPGRVNLIGEHVDYNDGFVLPMAVSLQTEMALRPRDDGQVVLYSPIFDEQKTFNLSHLQKQNSWIDYAQAVASVGHPDELHGFEGVVYSNVPLASGLSSSASFEVAVALAFLHLTGRAKTPDEIALLCQRAEHHFIGVQCGIMDQMAVAACIRDHALLLDCRSLFIQQVPFRLQAHAIVVTDSAAPRELAFSAYNERRAQCESGLAVLQRFLPSAQSLRDVSRSDFEKYRAEFDPVVARRISHVVGEIERTRDAVSALRRGDFVTFGEKMNDSHRSLRDEYEVSSPALDFLTDFARGQKGVLGSRMTGAGFGGCTVTLLEKDKAEAFITAQIAAYKQETGRQAQGWICEAAQGAEIVF